MSLIDEITTGGELLSLDVPEWEKTIYFYPFSLADADYATKMSKGSDGQFVAYMIIRKVLNENGDKHFTIGDKQKLMSGVNPDLLSRLVVEMKGDDDSGND